MNDREAREMQKQTAALAGRPLYSTAPGRLYSCAKSAAFALSAGACRIGVKRRPQIHIRVRMPPVLTFGRPIRHHTGAGMKAMGAVGQGRWLLPALLFWAATGATAYDGPVEKKVFTLPMYTTV